MGNAATTTAKKKVGVPVSADERTANFYLSEIEDTGREWWRTMAKERMKEIFNGLILSPSVPADKRDEIGKILTMYF